MDVTSIELTPGITLSGFDTDTTWLLYPKCEISPVSEIVEKEMRNE